MSAAQQIRANAMLCDAAQVQAEKLYILGAGWSHIWLVNPEAPFGFALAVDLVIPWDYANRRLTILARVLDADLEEFTPDNFEEPVRIEGVVIAGRSPTARAGTELHAQLVIPFAPMLLVPGSYVCELRVDNDVIHRSPFQVSDPTNPHG